MKRKRIILTSIVVLNMAVLTGCSGTGAESQSAAPATAWDTSYPGALPVEQQLALGTLQVEGTDNAVTAGQASKLLPFWQALRGVLSSPNPAQAEIDALLKQIESGMTADQIAAIRDMQLTQSSLVEWAQSSGVSLGGAFGPGGGGQGGGFADLRATIQADGEIPPEIQATIEAGGGQGIGPRGDLSPEARATIEAGGGPGFGPIGTISPEQRATLQAQGGPAGFRGAGLPIIDRLIEMLTARAKG